MSSDHPENGDREKDITPTDLILHMLKNMDAKINGLVSQVERLEARVERLEDKVDTLRQDFEHFREKTEDFQQNAMIHGKVMLDAVKALIRWRDEKEQRDMQFDQRLTALEKA